MKEKTSGDDNLNVKGSRVEISLAALIVLFTLAAITTGGIWVINTFQKPAPLDLSPLTSRLEILEKNSPVNTYEAFKKQGAFIADLKEKIDKHNTDLDTISKILGAHEKKIMDGENERTRLKNRLETIQTELDRTKNSRAKPTETNTPVVEITTP